ncbi:MAG: hypothetical protein OCD02_17465 [Spirochaetaceae bacterium]
MFILFEKKDGCKIVINHEHIISIDQYERQDRYSRVTVNATLKTGSNVMHIVKGSLADVSDNIIELSKK